MMDQQIQDQMHLQGGSGAGNGVAGRQHDAQTMEVQSQGDAGGTASGRQLLGNARQTGPKRFGSLPQVNVTSHAADTATQRRTRASDAGFASVDTSRTAILQPNGEIWSSNFTMARPKDHVKNNITKLLPSQVAAGARRAVSGYKPPVPYVVVEKKKLELERVKIKNIIGNNPFRVKNYVQGDELNNDLMPLKLLKPKDVSFDNDEEFIQHFLDEKKKQELAAAAERKKKGKNKGWQKLKLGVALGGMGAAGSKPSSSEGGVGGAKGRALQLKASLKKLIEQKKAQHEAQQMALKAVAQNAAEEAEDGKDNTDATGTHDSQEAKSKKANEVEGSKEPDAEEAADKTNDEEEPIRASPDQIFGDFDAEVELVRKLMRKQSQDAGKAKYARAGALGLKLGGNRKQPQGFNIDDYRSSNLQNQGKMAQHESQVQLHSFRRRESSIQQLAQLGSGGASGLIGSDRFGTNDQSLVNLNFVPQGSPTGGMTAKEMAEHSRSQVAFDMLTQSEYADSSQRQLINANHIGSGYISTVDGSQAQLSGLSFLPSQIKSFLSRKQPSPKSKQGYGEQSKPSFGARSLKPPNYEGSPSQASMLQSSQPGGPMNDGQGRGLAGVQIDIDRQQDQLAAMLRKDFMPGKADRGPNAAVAMTQINKIIRNAKRLENQNLSLRELADRMQGRIHSDRSTIALHGPADMFSNIKYFEKQFRLKKYEIEDLYLLRRAAKKEGERLQDSQLDEQSGRGSPEDRTMMQDAFAHLHGQSIQRLQQTQSGYDQLTTKSSNLLIPQQAPGRQPQAPGSQAFDVRPPSVIYPSQLKNQPPHNNDVIHVTLEAASMKQLIKLSQELIPEDQIEAEIEKQSTTFEGPNNSSIQDEQIEVAGLEDREVPMVGDPLPPPNLDHQENQSKIGMHVDKLSLALSSHHVQHQQHQPSPDISIVPNIEFTSSWHQHPTKDQLKAQRNSSHLTTSKLDQISNAGAEQPMERTEYTQAIPGGQVAVQLVAEQSQSVHFSAKAPPMQQSVGRITVAPSQITMEDQRTDRKRTMRSKKGSVASSKAIEKEKFTEITFQKAEKESRIFQRQLKLGDNLQRYLDEQQRKERLWHDVELGFRQTSPQKDEPTGEMGETLQSQNSSEMLLTAANHYILNTRENVIQSKIRSLLVGTELEDIAKSAQIVIHVQEDAKEYLRMKIQEQQEKRAQNRWAGPKDSPRLPKQELARLLNMNGGGSNSSMKSMQNPADAFDVGHVKDYGHTVLNQSLGKGLGTDDRKQQPTEAGGALRLDPNQQEPGRYVVQKAQGQKTQSPGSQFHDSNSGLQSRFNVDFTAKKGPQLVSNYQGGPTGFSGTLFNQNFQQNSHSGGPTSPRPMISHQMHDVMAGIDTDQFTDQMSGNRMKSKLGNVNSSDGDESVDAGQLRYTKRSHEAMQGGAPSIPGGAAHATGQHRGETDPAAVTAGKLHQDGDEAAEADQDQLAAAGSDGVATEMQDPQPLVKQDTLPMQHGQEDDQ